MHLLPHKSWNVWSAKNKEKVKKDELEHELKSQELKRKQIENEAEMRFSRLKMKKGMDSSQIEVKEPHQTKDQFCLFDEVEMEVNIRKYQQKIASDQKKDEHLPWYVKAPNNSNEEKSLQTKKEIDPLLEMKKYIKEKDKRKKRKREKREPDSSSSSNNKIAKLREERLKREESERQKARSICKRW